MRRTYRSKKDTGGGLDHRDVVLNMDEKSSAFDAFYIQNLKQTKRELSCAVLENHMGIASNKVRKRKYVKRLVKEVKPVVQRESLASSAFLTPDKSIRVNKVLDPFDMLLNSSSATQEPPNTKKVETIVPKKESKTYLRKRKPKIKKLNYSSSIDYTECDKENTNDLNLTDIKSHQLIIENVRKNSPKRIDESIVKIASNLSLINNLKHKSTKGSYNTSYKTRNKQNLNCQSPFSPTSPLCSTPFKEKYRGLSIYKFSPILIKEQMSPSSEENENNGSIILVSKSLARKSTHSYKVSPLTHTQDVKNETVLSVNENNKEVSIIIPDNEVQMELPIIDNRNESDNPILINDQSSCLLSEIEPFFGFSNNDAESLTKMKIGNNITLLGSQSIHNGDDLCENEIVTNASNLNNSSSNISRREFITSKSDNDSSSNGDTNEKISEEASSDNESVTKKSNTDNVSVESIDIDENKADSSSSNIGTSFDSSLNVEIDENELESSTSRKECQSASNISMDSNESSTSKYAVHSSDTESQYNTCDSDQDSVEDDRLYIREPVVAIERLNDSLFIKYYKQMLNSQDDEINQDTSFEDFESLANDTKEDTMSKLNIETSDSDEAKANFAVATDLFPEDDVIFVTTRRKNEVVNDSMFQIDKSSDSSFADGDKTVLSNTVNINKADNIVEHIPQDNIGESNIDAIENNEDMKTDSVQGDIAPRKSTRKTKLSVNSPQIADDFKSVNSDNDRMSLVSTRRSSRISRHSNKSTRATAILKQSKSPTNKMVPKTATRKNSRLPKQSNATHSEIDSSENEFTLTDSPKVDTTVIENDCLEKDTKCIDNREPISPSSVENSSRLTKKSVVSHPERLSCVGAEKSAIVLQPGKKWERSLSILRRMTMVSNNFDLTVVEDDCKQNKGRKYRQSVITTIEMQDSIHNDSINSRRSTFVSNPGRPTIRFVKDSNFSRVSLNTSSVFDDLKGFLSEECDDTVIELSKLSIAGSEREVTIIDNFHETERVTTARDYVLRRCNQTEPLLFDECYPETVLKNCHKIGEGVYGEVYLWRARDGRARVMKVVPIAGAIKVNGENQKDFHEIISEIVIAMELSALRAPIAEIERQLDEGHDINAVDLHTIENATDIFNEVLAVRCVYGSYPSRLLDLWELYDECKGSENDNPAALPADQRFIVLELANAGQDLESYQFASAQQAHALFQQIAFGLAVGEEAFQFEHRDLHWGNVLIAPTEQKFATFVLRGRAYRVARRGVAATVIDYSLSRLSLPLAGECAALYNDLAADDQLFDAVGDYQFELYRLMRDKLGNDWKNFEPYTNILWLHYIVDKMITALHYKRTNTKIHKHYIEKLKGIKGSILEYGSAVQYVLTDIDF